MHTLWVGCRHYEQHRRDVKNKHFVCIFRNQNLFIDILEESMQQTIKQAYFMLHYNQPQIVEAASYRLRASET